jgi:hypothetical protein
MTSLGWAGLAGMGAGLVGSGLAAFNRPGFEAAANKSFKGIKTFAESPYGKAVLDQAQADVNAAMPGEEQAKQGIGGATTKALSAAKTRKGGLISAGAAQAQEQKSLEDLATKKAQFKIGAKQRLAGVQEKAFQSEQQKQVMDYQKNLAQLSANRQAISQGLSGIGQGLGTFAYGGGFDKTV